MNNKTLFIAEIPYDNGNIQFRYSRYMSDDGTQWIPDGLFSAYYENGVLASEGMYSQGLETGVWKDFHENGQLASQGEYKNGKEVGVWQFWDTDGNIQETQDYGK